MWKFWSNDSFRTRLTSLLDYLGLNISWGLVSGDDCRRMIPWKWRRWKKVFFCSFGAVKNPLTMVEVSACCSDVCIENFVHLFELTVSSNGEGIAVGRRWQVSFQTTSYCLHCIPWINRHSRFWLSHISIEIFEVSCKCRRHELLQLFLVSRICK